MTKFLTDRKNKLFINEVQREINNYFSHKLSELGVKVVYHTESFAHPTAAGQYDDGVVRINLTDAAIAHQGYDTVHYIIAMAHELGHAYDYLVDGRKEPWLPLVFIKPIRDRFILAIEEAAYINGLKYIPSKYKAEYIKRNERYIAKLKKDPMLMQRGA